MIMDLGGSKNANAQAASDNWPHVLTFLDNCTKQENTALPQ